MPFWIGLNGISTVNFSWHESSVDISDEELVTHLDSNKAASSKKL